MDSLSSPLTPATPERRRRRVRFVHADLQRLSSAVCRARVELDRADSAGYVGTAVASGSEGLMATAQAAADALMQAVGDENILEVRGVKMLNTFGKIAIVVLVGAGRREKWRSLLGLCLAGEDPTRAAALAVLNATNRVLGSG